jgi:amino acid adenylation domain-containing protein
MPDINQRIAALAPEKRAILEQRLSGAREIGRESLTESDHLPVSRQQRPPVSFGQQRIWFLDQLEGSTAEYILSQALRLEGDLDKRALEGAIQALVDRHEALRTRFDDLEGEPFQVVEPSLRISLPLVDLTHLDEEMRGPATRAAISRECEEPFNLRVGPLIRTKLFRLSPRSHILFVAFHHIISDGWSIGVFNQELGPLYDAFRGGFENPLERLPLQYPDYAAWRRTYLQGAELERLLSYWRSQLADIATLQLPNDRPRPDRQSFDAESRAIGLPRSVCDKLRTLASEEGATMAMLMLAAFKLLLHRLAGQDDIAVGAPVAGRNRRETEALIGFFVNTVVLRTDLSGRLTFRQLLDRVRTTILEAYAHQDAPFEKLVEVLKPERNLSRHPLFEVFYNYVNFAQVPQLRVSDLSVESLEIDRVLGNFPMTLYVKDKPEGIELKLVYQKALFSPERVAHFLDQFQHLVTQIAEQPDGFSGSHSLVTEKARTLLPDPTISLAEPAQVPVTSRFLANAEANPHRGALRQEGSELTYQELAKSAKEVARALIARGLLPGEVVAVSGQRSFGLIAGIMGVLLARGVLLMLDSSLPLARRVFMLQAAAGKHWLSVNDTELVSAWGQAFTSLPRTEISSNGSVLDAPEQSLGALDPYAVRPDDPAYVFFTSGTTGMPKGIRGSHKGLSHFLHWEQEALSITSTDRVAQLTGMSFDVVLRDIFLPLSAGATLCLPDSESTPHGTDTISWMKRERVTILHTVPSLAAAWLDSPDSSAALPDLRWTLMAGEPLSDTLVGRWCEKIGTAHQILNLYGPTETTLAKCAYRIPAEPAPGVQPLGRPLPNTQTFVINKTGQLCGIGEPGEIVIRTPFRTLGYLNVAEESHNGFVRNPFRDDADDLIYRTGDRGSYGNDGLLHISGRMDDQVKIRGNRVEPGEVAMVLRQHPEMQECAVLARDGENGEKVLVAYLVRKLKQTDITIVALRDFLKQRLPDYMLPAGFVLLDKLPLTPNGKLDRKALLASEVTPLQRAGDYVAPRDTVEQTLAKLWSDLLRLERVGISDDFFELGGHSLIATRLVSQIRKEFDVEIPLRAIFESTTIERLALEITKRQAASIASADVEQLLSRLEALPEETAVQQFTEANGDGRKFSASEQVEPRLSPFACPKTPSKLFGKRECNLVIVINERFERKGFEELAGYVREFDPSIHALVMRDRAPMDVAIPKNPTLIFSPALIRHAPEVNGRIFCGYPLSKSEEYVTLEKAGIPVPKWMLLTEDSCPDLSDFDDFIVKKPDHGGRGAEVKIIRKHRVRWKSVMTRSAGECSSFILQRFIYTGPRPVCYRVNTLFGKVLYSKKYQMREDRPAWNGPEDKEFSGRSIVASSPDSKVEANYDEEIIRFGEWAHSAFPEIPLLGFDIVRELPSGKLFVLEANAIGYVWSFFTGQEASYGFSSEKQFDGLRKAAYILAEKTQECAS